ncbi:MAG: Isoquinoline 1-oxidoreductase subunit [bacterium]|nr:Isoquinoline 1-oxidoreductase subunit [bacterium]
MLRKPILPGLLLVVLAFAVSTASTGSGGAELRGAEEFAGIKNKSERSVALFTEAGKVIQHPRCVNCHPSGDSPLQGETGDLHEPPVQRGLGPVGMRCRTCHGPDNFDPGAVPGASKWLLAPRKMGWEDLSLGEICKQIKDPERNGDRTLREITEHMGEDHLVAWAWTPGAGREPAPGNQEILGELIAKWVKTGAVCP